MHDDQRGKKLSRTGKREVKSRIIQDSEGRALPVYVLITLKTGDRLQVTTTTTTTVEVIKEKKPPRTPRVVASARPGNRTRKFRPSAGKKR